MLDSDGSLLRSVSYMAEQYLASTPRSFVHEKDQSPDQLLDWPGVDSLVAVA